MRERPGTSRGSSWLLRALQIALVLVAVACTAGAFWTATRRETVSDTKCGPILTQGNRRFAVCDHFYRTYYLRTGVLGGAALVTYAGSSVAQRVDAKRSGRRRPR